MKYVHKIKDKIIKMLGGFTEKEYYRMRQGMVFKLKKLKKSLT